MRPLITLAASAVVLLALTGCTVSVSEPSTEQSTSSQQSDDTTTESTGPDDAENEQPAAETPSESQQSPVPATDDTTWSAEVAEGRDAALAAVTKTVSCSGELVIGSPEIGQIIQVDGVCEHLVVQADAAIVIAGDVVTLDVYADGAVAYVDSISVLNVSGSADAVYWTGATPEVANTGAGNVLTAG